MQAEWGEQDAARVAAAAGFWRRLGGALIDGIVLGIVGTVLRFALGTSIGEALSGIADAVYFTYFHGSTGRTPGDAALGIRVVDLESGEVIGFARAFARWLVSIVSAVVLVLGFLWMLWDPRRQTWHDKAVGSLPVLE